TASKSDGSSSFLLGPFSKSASVILVPPSYTEKINRAVAQCLLVRFITSPSMVQVRREDTKDIRRFLKMNCPPSDAGTVTVGGACCAYVIPAMNRAKVVKAAVIVIRLVIPTTTLRAYITARTMRVGRQPRRL